MYLGDTQLLTIASLIISLVTAEDITRVLAILNIVHLTEHNLSKNSILKEIVPFVIFLKLLIYFTELYPLLSCIFFIFYVVYKDGE